MRLPAAFVALTTRARVTEVTAPEMRVGNVGDWLAHALDRHEALCALADAHRNPSLTTMVPFADTPRGFEIALDLASETGRIVWLDPARFESVDGAVVTVCAASIEAYVRDRIAGVTRTAAR
jgi:hypothetical protein